MTSVPTGHASEVLQQFPKSKSSSVANHRKHNADLSGFIPDVFREIDPVSSSDDAFCESCSEIHFGCSVISAHRCRVADTSTIGATLSNGQCPSCRLIAHCIKSSARAQSISLESKILLTAAPLFFDGPPDRQGEDANVSLKCVEIRLCRQNPKSGEAIETNYGEIIGVLLPAKGDEFSDSIRTAGHEALFNTLKYQGSVYARPITQTVDVKLLRAWIDHCTVSHSFCRITKTSIASNISLRLIDVVERRLIDATLVEEYIALSYVWGSGNDKILTKSTMRHLQERGSLSSTIVPRLVADVMDLVAKIGERYLWIDTACIIQDDHLDKLRQLPNMSSIYKHAKLTIVAAVEGANDPLPRWNKCQHRVLVPTELIRGIAHTVGGPPLVTALINTTWNRRGWTFQEAFLARRLLVFTEDLIYWSCREESWREDQYTEFHNVKSESTPERSLFATSVRESYCNGNESVTKLCAMGLYAQHAHDYSHRLFSNYSDVVWAFLGVLKASKEHFPNGYIWALPYDQLDAALLWLTCCEQAECVEHQCDLSPESRLPIPSWCWIGKGHMIWYTDGICETKSRVTWHEPVKSWTSHIDTVDDDQEIVDLSQVSVLRGPQLRTEKSGIFDYAFLHFTAQTAMLSIELEPDPSNLKIFNTLIRNGLANSKCHSLVAANIRLPSKRAIGQILVPSYIFRNDTQKIREFALLSEYIGTIHMNVLNSNRGTVEGREPGKGSDHDPHEHDNGSSHQQEEAARGIETEKHQNQEFWDSYEEVVPEEHKDGCSHHPALNVMLIEWDETHDIKNFARRVSIARIDPSAWEEVEITEKTIILG